MTLWTGIVIGLGSCIATLAWLIWNAPVGHEIPGVGFVYGPPELPDAGRDGVPLNEAFQNVGREPTDRLASRPSPSFHATGVDDA